MTPEKIRDFDPLVELKFRSFVMIFLKKYHDNPTRKKFMHLILNLPIGFILKQDDLQHFVEDEIPSYKDCTSIINRLEIHLTGREDL